MQKQGGPRYSVVTPQPIERLACDSVVCVTLCRSNFGVLLC